MGIRDMGVARGGPAHAPPPSQRATRSEPTVPLFLQEAGALVSQGGPATGDNVALAGVKGQRQGQGPTAQKRPLRTWGRYGRGVPAPVPQPRAHLAAR